MVSEIDNPLLSELTICILISFIDAALTHLKSFHTWDRVRAFTRAETTQFTPSFCCSEEQKSASSLHVSGHHELKFSNEFTCIDQQWICSGVEIKLLGKSTEWSKPIKPALMPRISRFIISLLSSIWIICEEKGHRNVEGFGKSIWESFF